MQELQTLVDPKPIAAPYIVAAPWYVVLTQPQQEIPLVWRLHELGLEMYTPIVRVKLATGRRDRQSGQKVLRTAPRPMFPGYGFIRQTGLSIPEVLATRGARDFLRIRGEYTTIPHEAVLAVFAEQRRQKEQHLADIGGRKSTFKPGDMVRFDDANSVYSGLVSKVESIDARGRIEVLFGMIRHTLPADMVVLQHDEG